MESLRVVPWNDPEALSESIEAAGGRRFRSMSTAIPVIDLGADDVAAAFCRAYGEVGFAYLERHGVEPGLVEEAFAQSERFHALPLEEKLRLKINDQHRGYMPFAESKIVSSSIQKATKPNLSESLMVMHEVDAADPDRADDPLAGPNQWPELPGFREAIMAYEGALSTLARRLVAIFEKALGAGPGPNSTTWISGRARWFNASHLRRPAPRPPPPPGRTRAGTTSAGPKAGGRPCPAPA